MDKIRILRGEMLWGRAAENNMNKHMERGVQDVRSKETGCSQYHHHIRIAIWYNFHGLCKGQNDIKVLMWSVSLNSAHL